MAPNALSEQQSQQTPVQRPDGPPQMEVHCWISGHRVRLCGEGLVRKNQKTTTKRQNDGFVERLLQLWKYTRGEAVEGFFFVCFVFVAIIHSFYIAKVSRGWICLHFVGTALHPAEPWRGGKGWCLAAVLSAAWMKSPRIRQRLTKTTVLWGCTGRDVTHRCLLQTGNAKMLNQLYYQHLACLHLPKTNLEMLFAWIWFILLYIPCLLRGSEKTFPFPFPVQVSSCVQKMANEQNTRLKWVKCWKLILHHNLFCLGLRVSDAMDRWHDFLM